MTKTIGSFAYVQKAPRPTQMETEAATSERTSPQDAKLDELAGSISESSEPPSTTRATFHKMAEAQLLAELADAASNPQSESDSEGNPHSEENSDAQNGQPRRPYTAQFFIDPTRRLSSGSKRGSVNVGRHDLRHPRPVITDTINDEEDERDDDEGDDPDYVKTRRLRKKARKAKEKALRRSRKKARQ